MLTFYSNLQLALVRRLCYITHVDPILKLGVPCLQQECYRCVDTDISCRMTAFSVDFSLTEMTRLSTPSVTWYRNILAVTVQLSIGIA